MTRGRATVARRSPVQLFHLLFLLGFHRRTGLVHPFEGLVRPAVGVGDGLVGRDVAQTADEVAELHPAVGPQTQDPGAKGLVLGQAIAMALELVEDTAVAVELVEPGDEVEEVEVFRGDDGFEVLIHWGLLGWGGRGDKLRQVRLSGIGVLSPAALVPPCPARQR